MRRFLNSTGLALALALVANGGCKCGDGDKKSAPPDKTGATAGGEGERKAPPDRQAIRDRAEALRKMRLSPITLEEVQPLIPKLPGAVAVGQPGVLTNGRQVKAVFCMTSPSTDTAMTQLVGAIGAVGFTGVATQPHPQSGDTVTLHAEKQTFRLGATVQTGKTPDCPGAEGKIKIVLSYFKRVAPVPEGEGSETPQPAPLAPTP